MWAKRAQGRCQVELILLVILCWAKRARANVEWSVDLSWPWSTWAKRARTNVEWSRLELMSSASLSKPKPMSSRTCSGNAESLGLGPCWIVQAQADVEPNGPGQCWVKQARVDVKPNGPGPGSMSVFQARADVESIGPGSMSVFQARADVESSEHKSISSRSSSGVDWARAGVKSSKLGLRRTGVAWANVKWSLGLCIIDWALVNVSQAGPSQCRASLSGLKVDVERANVELIGP